jgi:hypothetical protein
MITEDKLDSLMSEAINHLADDNPKMGVEALVEIADVFAKAGMPQEIFYGIRKHIIDQATAKTDSLFILEKVKLAEKAHQKLGSGIITALH